MPHSKDMASVVQCSSVSRPSEEQRRLSFSSLHPAAMTYHPKVGFASAGNAFVVVMGPDGHNVEAVCHKPEA